MDNLYYIPLVLIAVVAYKAVSNFYYLRRVRSLRELHLKYIEEAAKPKGEGKPEWDIIQRSSEIVELFKRAGIKDHTTTRMRPLGYGQGITERASVFDNVGATDPEFAYGVLNCFYEAEGVYRRRIGEAVNPFYWVETIVFLPAKLAQYAGASPGSWVTRVANVVGWFVLVTGFLFSLPDFQETRTGFSAWLAGVLESLGL